MAKNDLFKPGDLVHIDHVNTIGIIMSGPIRKSEQNCIREVWDSSKYTWKIVYGIPNPIYEHLPISVNHTEYKVYVPDDQCIQDNFKWFHNGHYAEFSNECFIHPIYLTKVS